MNCKPLLILLFLTLAICADANIVITEVIGTNETCNSSNGTIRIIIQGDTTGILYSIDAGDTFQSSNYFENLESGDYLIAATDGLFCTEFYTEQITEIDLPSVDIFVECKTGYNFVDIDLTPPSGAGIPPYTFDWTGPNGNYSTEDLTSVPPGDYFVSVVDRDGCKVDTSFVVPECCHISTLCSSDTTYLDCLGDYKEVSSSEFENLNSFTEQSEMLSSLLGITLDGDPCYGVQISIQNNEERSDDCTTALKIEQSIEISDGNQVVTCDKVYFIDNYLGLTIETEAADLSIDCASNYEELFSEYVAAAGGALFTSCDTNPKISSRPEFLGADFGCLGETSTEIVIVIEDSCGNIDSTSFVLSAVDSEQPVLVCPADLSFSSGSDSVEKIDSWLSEIQGIDNCSTPTVTHDFKYSDLPDDCAGAVIPIAVTAIDACGNVAMCQLSIIAEIEGPPIISCPENLLVECQTTDLTPIINDWLDSATGADSENTIMKTTNNFDYNFIGSFSCSPDGHVVTFEVETNCGKAVCNSSIILTDNESPILNCPEDLFIDFDQYSDENFLLSWLDGVVTEDNCSEVELVHDFEHELLAYACFKEIPVQFVANDSCSNISTCSSLITIEQYNELLLECPDDLVIGCEGLVPDSIDYQLLREIEIGSDIPYDLEYSYGIDVYDIGCEFIYNFEAQIAVIDSCANEKECMIQVQIEPEPEVYIPNVFAPAQSGQRYFTIYANRVITEVEKLYIYDKWGELVYDKYNFQPNDESCGWDGKYNQSNDDGSVYVYYVLLKSITGKEYEFKGDVTLLR